MPSFRRSCAARIEFARHLNAMPRISQIRRSPALLLLAALLAFSTRVSAQGDGDTPLGDVARNLRRKTSPPQTVIDNDNLSKAMDDAEGRRLAGSAPVFSLEPGGKSFHVSTPDVTCSLSFSAKAASLLSDPLELEQLPSAELAKLDGPASIDGDLLQISLHNGTQWELREIVIGLTIVSRPDPRANTSFSTAGPSPTVGANAHGPTEGSLQRGPDATVLFRIKGSASASSTATFRTPLNAALSPDQEWHWAIVRAKGVPPSPTQASLSAPAQSLR